MKITLKLVLFFLLISCGYQPVYLNQDINKLQFSNINLSGNDQINKQIINFLQITEELGVENKTKQLFLNTNYIIYETSKDSKGLTTSYRSEIEVDFTIKIEEEITAQKKFIENFDYNNLDSKFELIEYQNNVKNDLIKKIIEDIILFVNTK